MTTAEKLQKSAEYMERLDAKNKELEKRLNGGEVVGGSYQDKFWDAYQDYGKRTIYEAGFGGLGWNDTTFNPKYPIIPINAYLMFYSSGITDCYDILQQIDFSECIELTNVFVQSKIQHIGTVNTTSATRINGTFGSNNLKTIDKIILKSNGSQTFNSGTFNAKILESVTIEGVIGQNIWFRTCTNLTTASLLSILTALSKDSTLATGKTITLATEHKAKIEADAACTAQLNAAIAAGWTVAYV